MPGFIKPQLATLKSKAPKGDQWLHAIKFDGYRIQVHINRGRKKVFTRKSFRKAATTRTRDINDRYRQGVGTKLHCLIGQLSAKSGMRLG